MASSSSSFVTQSLATIVSHSSSSFSSAAYSHSPIKPRSVAAIRSPTCLERRRLLNHGVRLTTKRGFSVKMMSEDYGYGPPTSEYQKPPSSDLIPNLKFKLLSAVSGVNRGLAANEDDLRKADEAAKELEEAGGPVDLSSNIDILQGRWKLIYSSAFSSRTLGGSRPGPPTGRLLPITLGQVFQRIDVLSKDFDNIVELELGAPWPLPPLEVTATLAHKFELIGCSKIKIVFEKTTVKTRGNLSQLPPIEVPRIPDGFRPPSNTGSGEFEVTYVDSETRITRGDRGELRVFVIS